MRLKKKAQNVAGRGSSQGHRLLSGETKTDVSGAAVSVPFNESKGPVEQPGPRVMSCPHRQEFIFLSQ